ncbi:MAG: bifunctional precorrin-2 dehydrogenase/sirohydrochlorin ferrochelatase [Candidatus Zixiibacteriota bacterium]|nr:MAG: bifunctional precorrin-2 dehydrogenase/sirohydrochlorin ferrochelatase [candidate division Zixibacteria bacterium]
MANKYMPINVSLENRRCLVVGGGDVALRKIETLLEYKSDITVVAPKPNDKIEYFANKEKITLEKREYKISEASGYGLVISASNSRDVNVQVSKDCRENGVPVNVVDDPSLCDFIFPAVVKRDILSVAISTDGQAPFLAGQLRLILEDIFPQRWKKIAAYASKFRKKVMSRWRGQSEKKALCYSRFVQTDWQKILKDKSDDEIEALLDGLVEEDGGQE